MYLVVHDDEARGEAIVAALGGEPAARLVSDAASLDFLVRKHGKPAAVLIATDAPGASTQELFSSLDGVPILCDGGSPAAVYRVFTSLWEPRRPFHLLAAASPEEAARALVRLAAEGEPVAPRGRWQVVRAAGFLGLVLQLPIRWVLHALLPAGGHWPLVEGLVLLALLLTGALVVGLPLLAAVARGLRPTRGVVAKAVLVVVFVASMSWALLREAMSIGS